jgi:Caspase domain
MSADLLEPRDVLAIVLGASKWPEAPNLPPSELFANSARHFTEFLTSEEGFNIPSKNLLNLFDIEQSPNEIDSSISRFLIERQSELNSAGAPARDLLIYYVGHGGFTADDQKYFLAVRTTRRDREGASSVRMSDLARTLKQDAKELRRYFVLDCCFAASAFVELQSTGVAEATRVKTLSEFPKKGTALLCASSAHDVALAPRGEQYTMFSGALLEVLKSGDPALDSRLSLEQLGERVREAIKRKYPDNSVRPEVSSPDQREGDVANIPLFPNLALESRQLRTRLSRLEKTVETILGKISKIDGAVGTLASLQEKIAKVEAERGAVDKEDVSGVGSIRQGSLDIEWLRESLPTEMAVQLRRFRLAALMGSSWMLLSLMLCLPLLFSLVGIRVPIPVFQFKYLHNPLFWLVSIFAVFSLVVFISETWQARYRVSQASPDEEKEQRPWERLPEVIAMRSTKTYSPLGSLHIVSPFFEIGAALFVVTSILCLLASIAIGM